MNWVLIVVLLIMTLSVIWGYKKGFIHIAYSLVAGLLALLFVSWAMPHINHYVLENTSLYEKLETSIEEAITQRANEQTQEEIDENQNKGEDEDEITSLGIKLPEAISRDILEKLKGTTDEFLENNGVYAALAKNMAELVIKGISFLTALVVAWILIQVVSKLLGVVAKIPIIKGANHTLGLLAGGVSGLILVWILFCVVALSTTSEFGATVVANIYDNRLLTYLYENNGILQVILLFF